MLRRHYKTSYSKTLTNRNRIFFSRLFAEQNKIYIIIFVHHHFDKNCGNRLQSYLQRYDMVVYLNKIIIKTNSILSLLKKK